MIETNPYQSPRTTSAASVPQAWLRPLDVRLLACGVPIFGISCGLGLLIVFQLIHWSFGAAAVPENAFETLGIVVVGGSVAFLGVVPLVMLSNRYGRLSGKSAFKTVSGFGVVVIVLLLGVNVVSGQVVLFEIMAATLIALSVWLAGSTGFGVWIGLHRRRHVAP